MSIAESTGRGSLVGDFSVFADLCLGLVDGATEKKIDKTVRQVRKRAKRCELKMLFATCTTGRVLDDDF